MRRLLVLLMVFGFTQGGGVDASSATAKKRRPLDLPSGGPGANEEDEDSSETISFFGGEYEGDAFFFLLDVSGSMYGEKMVLLKEELSSSLDSLSVASEFAIVAFSDHLRVFSPRPERATSSAKLRAKAWASELRALGSTHMLEGAERLLLIANKSRQQHKIVIVVGDGLPSDPGVGLTLLGILAANTDSLPFFTILIGLMTSAETFMKDLATLTGGVYRYHDLD